MKDWYTRFCERGEVKEFISPLPILSFTHSISKFKPTNFVISTLPTAGYLFSVKSFLDLAGAGLGSISPSPGSGAIPPQ